jgi:DNA-binding transcriptional MerR regulator
MQYGVEELARAANLSVDTLRYYQTQKLLPPPTRVGRRAVYATRHLERLRRIRRLQSEGLPLGVIRRVLGERRAAGDLARALRAERGDRRLTRGELAAEAGVPEALIRAVEDAGILEPERTGDDIRYTEADVALARTALALLNERLPLAELLGLAIHQAETTREGVDRAIELFDRHVRRDPHGAERSPEAVIEAFRRMLPAVTALVANHFQRTLVSRALARLERLGDRDGLRHALAATRDAGRLEVAWR